MVRENMKERLEKLELENEKLKIKVQEAEQVKPDIDLDYFNEIQRIKQTGRVDTNKIEVREIVDHKNISLWTKWGKRVGPLHPHNAEQIYERFFNVAKSEKKPWLRLLAQQPSEKQIEAWKKTSEGKAYLAELKASRDKKDRTKRKGAVDRLAEQMSKMYGVQKEQINSVKDKAEVGIN